MSADVRLNNLTLRVLRDRAYGRFLQKWRRDVVMLRERRMGNAGPLIGDLTCRFNAQSAYLRCAINPLGPCETCNEYEARPGSLGQ